MERKAGYIEAMIQNIPDMGFNRMAEESQARSGKTHVELAEHSAQNGSPGLTASHLRLTKLPVYQSGKILATAFVIGAEGLEGQARDTRRDDLAASYRSETQQFRRTAQKLTQEVQRSRNS